MCKILCKPVANIALMRQCPLKHKECPLKRQVVGRVVRSFEIQVAWTHERLCGGQYAKEILWSNMSSFVEHLSRHDVVAR